MKSETERRKACWSVALYSVLSFNNRQINRVCFISQRSCREAIGFKKCAFSWEKRSTIRHTSEFKPLSSSIKV